MQFVMYWILTISLYWKVQIDTEANYVHEQILGFRIISKTKAKVTYISV